MFQEYSTVISKVKLSDKVSARTLGAILIVYNENNFEVEFVDESGDTLEILTIKALDIDLYP